MYNCEELAKMEIGKEYGVNLEECGSEIVGDVLNKDNVTLVHYNSQNQRVERTTNIFVFASLLTKVLGESHRIMDLKTS